MNYQLINKTILNSTSYYPTTTVHHPNDDILKVPAQVNVANTTQHDNPINQTISTTPTIYIYINNSIIIISITTKASLVWVESQNLRPHAS